MGLYRDPKHELSLHGSESPAKHGAVLVALASPDAAAQKKVLGALLAKARKKSKKGVVIKGDSLFGDLDDGKELRIEPRKGFVLIGAGEKKLVAELSGRFGKEKDSMGSDLAFTEARTKAKPSHLLGYVDLSALAGPLGGKPGAKAGGGSTFGLTLGRSDRGIEATLESDDGGMALLGTSSALAIYGVRRYLAEAKVSEAKNTVGAIVRAAVSSFEMEGGVGRPLHALCKSATPVPSSVQAGAIYKPSTQEGQDFNTGNETTGWRCLRLTLTEPFRYQYEYRVGGSYKGPKRGGPDPGKNGFEASAEGDLDGDGKTSLFTMTGKIEKGELRLDPELFVADEME